MKSIWYIILVFLAGFLPGKLLSQILQPDDNASSVRFSIRNFGFTTTGTFKGLEGHISFDPKNIMQSHFDASIAASTINTGISARDRHLKSEDYFDAGHFPMITIKSETVRSGNTPGSFILHGELALKGVSRTIDIPFTAKQVNGGVLFEGEFTLNRLDYKVGSNSISLADNVNIELKVMAR
ncbi:YceI family protein [Flavihumibacter profundi]|uniref:YceI family protein n=1 Tax=Flavihumibacter profundi TaxID=2716883 RepID=UPI001CC45498|nr:YceI family protein [Flavihumibacter profundi]MBZ5855841.1 YceI family protein [Flavihumibacter profundi]